MPFSQLSFDQLFLDVDGATRFLVAGVDEAGRGPLAGRVLAAAVILDPDKPVHGLADSKKLTEASREALYPEILQNSAAWAVAGASVAEIDKLNILHASMLAMARAIEALPLTPHHCLIDGNRCPTVQRRCQAIVKGDALVQEISAASILAKVVRDREMRSLHQRYPQYGFARHKGYPTSEHLAAIRSHGVLREHRRSFAPVKRSLRGCVTEAER